ncbi:efflux RND transporter permease subunit [bacterium]|nr:efflux RND transporter permease subunit [bacterium]
MTDPRPDWQRGPLAWMAANPVAANLLMLILVVGGIWVGLGVKQEVFPHFDTDIITIDFAYPGASPEEVEQGAVLSIEDAVRSLDGVKSVRSTSYEGAGVVVVELLTGADKNKATSDVKNAVDRITSFPRDLERPIVSLVAVKAKVITLVLHGDTTYTALRELADQARNELLNRPDITEVTLTNAPYREIGIELDTATLREYGLTLPQVADIVRSYAVELPGGAIRTDGGEILIKLDERRDAAEEFADIPLRTSQAGAVLSLGDVATITGGFAAESYLESRYNSERAQMLEVFRVGDQTPITVSAAVRDYAEELNARLPDGLRADTVYDDSIFYAGRIGLLKTNGYIGFFLVLILLTLFLEPRLALWTTLGIPISFFGAMLLMPTMDVSFNMISLFGFIVTLGLVVDDAIVVGENVYHMREQGMGRLEAAVKGARGVAAPVIFAILTTIVAFSPMLFVPGPAGKFFRVLPAIVICVLLISLVESLLVLPSHLAHSRRAKETGIEGRMLRVQRAVAAWLDRFIDRRYTPAANWAVRNKWLSLAIAIALFLSSIGLVAGGRIKSEFFPNIESDFIIANISMDYGVSVDATRVAMNEAVDALDTVLARYDDSLVEDVITELGSHPNLGPAYRPGGGIGSSHLSSVQATLVPSERRNTGAKALADAWRAELDKIPGIDRINLLYTTGPGAGAGITVQLKHRDVEVLERAADDLAATLAEFDGLYDIDNGYSGGKTQFNVRLLPLGKTLGLTAQDVGRQVRGAFFGSEAFRQQDGRDEVRVMVRLPEAQRSQQQTLENLLVRTPGGGYAPLREVAEITTGQAYTTIRRDQGRRILNVTANLDSSKTQTSTVVSDLSANALPALKERIPGLKASFEGANRDEAESQSAIFSGFGLALLVMFALLAMAFRSYVQPLIIMSCIPFGVVGAIAGHWLLGYKLSFISLFGIVALSGVVVNDSLVLIDAANKFRAQGMSAIEAIVQAGRRRFRPILLTSLTTFLGLSPMILETSLQARFIIPMAISLGFGVLFATFIILLLTPAVYMIVEDLRGLLHRLFGAREHPEHDSDVAQ